MINERLHSPRVLVDNHGMASRRVSAWVAVAVSASGLAGCSTGSAASVTVPPAVAGGYPSDVAAVLCSVGLRPLFVQVPAITAADRNVNGYAVTSVSPGPTARVAVGATVEIHVGVSHNAGGPWPQAPDRSVLPNLLGIDVNRAVATLAALGATVNVSPKTPTGALVVTGQTPRAGATVMRGSPVTVQVGAAAGSGCSTTP